MHLRYPSIFLGLLFRITLLPALIIHLPHRWSVNVDERLYCIQKRVKDFQEDDLSRLMFQLHMVSNTRFGLLHAVVGKAVRALLSYGSVGSFRRCVFGRGF